MYRRRERPIGFRSLPPVLEDEVVKALERMAVLVRDRDMIDSIRENIELLSRFSGESGDLEREKLLPPQERFRILDDLGENIAKTAPFYGPFQNAGAIVKRIARRVLNEEDIMSRVKVSRIVRCITEVFDKYFETSLEKAVEPCAGMEYESIILHTGGQLPVRCLARMVREGRKPRVYVVGRNARGVARALVERLGLGMTAVPGAFSYQILPSVQAVLFQPETITPEILLTRAGAAPLLEADTPAAGEVEAVGLTISIAYQRLRGLGRITYQSVPVTPFKLRWLETIDVPVFDIIPIRAVRRKLRIIDEQGEAELSPSKLGRRSLRLVREIESLVEARCRVYEI